MYAGDVTRLILEVVEELPIGDYPIAVEEGATWIRLGTVLFGERPKMKPQRLVDAGDAGESGEGGGGYDRILD